MKSNFLFIHERRRRSSSQSLGQRVREKPHRAEHAAQHERVRGGDVRIERVEVHVARDEQGVAVHTLNAKLQSFDETSISLYGFKG